MNAKKFYMILLLLVALGISFSSFAGENGMSQSASNDDTFKEPWLTTSKTHQYLGLGSLAFGVLTAMSPKPNPNDYKDSLHRKFALGATYLGGAALASGFVFHYKDLSLNKLFRNPDNLHALFATIGTVGFLLAVNAAPEESHATPGIVGLAGMATAVKITW